MKFLLKLLCTLKSVFLLLSSLILIPSCNHLHNRSKPFQVLGPEEFAYDSSLIRQGKASIKGMQGNFIEELSSDTLEEYKDTIAEDDILNIAIYHPKRRDIMESVQAINTGMGGFKVIDGKVSLPDIAPVYVEGLTLLEAQQRLTIQYREEINDVEVFVSYQNRLSNKVEIIGMARTPIIPIDGRIRLYEVLALAQLLPDANLFASYVLRNKHQLNVDFNKLIREGDMSQNIVMRGGDKIFVAAPGDSFAMVMGEVFSPRIIPLHYGYISLREAIVIAHGIPYTGDRQHIQVIRGGIECPRIYDLAWDFMVHQPNEDLLLMPGDVVYVNNLPITDWNLFLIQLAPTLKAIIAGEAIYQISQR